MKRSAPILALALLLTLVPAPPTGADDAPDLLFILDASGSMWGQIGGENKIVIARRVLKDAVGKIPDGSAVGLVAYGHRREGDCADVETVVPMGPLDRGALVGTIDSLNPKGKTPITLSIEQAIEIVKGRDGGATVVLVSDGIETCGGDPCAVVRAARAAGVEILMHVVGFDVGEVDTSQLECAAQAGGGLYFDARDAGELSAALETAVAAVEVPDGRLSVKATADGSLADAVVRVTDVATGEEAAVGRTYTGAETNPREVPLEDGTYDVVVRSGAIKGAPEHRFQIEIKDGGRVEKEVDFSSGELAILVKRNGELSDATVRVYAAGTNDQKAAGRTYRREHSNPRVIRLAAGTYDVALGSVEIEGKPGHRFEGVEVPPGGRAELEHEFRSAELTVGAVQGGERVDAVVYVRDAASGREVARARTYTSPGSNPKTFTMPPGSYRVEARAVSLEGKPEKELDVTLEAGASETREIDFGA